MTIAKHTSAQVLGKVYNGDTDPALIVKGLNGLVNFKFDYVALNSSGATTDIYTFKTGGSGGTLVATITINYTDSTKDTMVDAVRT